jgi:outer membrane protein assembly factor BamA
LRKIDTNCYFCFIVIPSILINSSNKTLFYFAKVGIILSIFIVSCNPAKYVPKDKYFLNSVNIKILDNSIKPEALNTYIKQKPNKKILGWFRFHLGVYNISNLKKENRWNKFLRNIGEEPAIWDKYLTEKTLNQFTSYMKNKGFYNSMVYDSVYIKGRKANVVYYIKGGTPYTIRDIHYNVQDTNVLKVCYSDTINSLLIRGDKFDMDVSLQNERIRIERLLKNNGYYNFSREYVYYDADSTLMSHEVNLTTVISNPVNSMNSVEINFHKQYKVRQILVSAMVDPLDVKRIRTATDTIYVGKGIYMKDIKELRVNPRSFAQSIYIQPGKLYNENSVDETYKHVSSLNLYKMVDIKFTELPNSSDTSKFMWLDCNLRLSPSSLQSYNTELVGTNSSGNIGGALNLVYQHKNLFKNAEVLDMKLKGALEALKEQNSHNISRTEEFGIETSIKFPKFLIPISNENFIKKNNPNTVLSLSYNYQKRPDFTRKVANIGFGYTWKETRYKEHIFRPIEINYVNISSKPSFDSIISGTYLESSYRPHLISLSSYSYIFNNQNIKKNRNFNYFRLNAELAGNSLSLFNKYFVQAQDSGFTYYKFLGIQYSQFVRTDIEYKYYDIINSSSNMVYRFFAGVAYPYGNARAIPFEKRYFSGGANGLRGWQLRSLGPGSYVDTVSSKVRRFPNSTGDIKLEFNMEYRFKLFWVLEGALFMDAGNIWAIRKEGNSPGALFQWDRFYKELALDSGIGMRFDFSFFLFRVDVGMKMIDPSQDIGNRFIFGSRSISWNDLALNIGIGYPF